MVEKKRFKTDIDGKSYTFIGTASDEHMQSVAQILNHELATIKQQASDLNSVDAALLVAFNAISKQLDLQLQLDDLQTTTHEKDNQA
ncbi:hypothetical protein B808_1233 [Fructilactobacillus florum 8D]|uniref:Cell division protein ZapA n=1 Tax=Fructilactobacillus florum 8D TaxID=1221538 RepID=W9ECX6_9LACO|nr:cell division protein ZapA [Fructilactobacillus florum]EKK20919.1 hypothetical protein B807_329 [Fructilactobacillus florum 2F]ETO39902.1 hypothetical protein B808_1233 [Fructilactobacillus florum 8D]